MAVFRCGRFPHGEAHIRTRRGLVLFVDGQATVDDPELVAALREQPASFGITEDGAEEAEPRASASSARPPRRRTKPKEA